MKQNAGLLAATAVFVAFFGFSNLPKSPTSGESTPAATQTKHVAKTQPQNGPPVPACEEIRKRLQPFLQQPNLEQWRLPDSCYDPQNPTKVTTSNPVPAGVHFVIATAPNPISTHLPLVFDRMIEVMQQAAQDDNYSYDDSWFPWDEVSKNYTYFADQLRAQDAQQLQEEQPGILLFRRAVLGAKNGRPQDTLPYLGGLIVFVIDEKPTGGIDRKEFFDALEWIDKLGGLTPDRGLKVLGPSFSGSLPSLDQALDSPKLKPAKSSAITTFVTSGSVSSESSYLWFQKRMDARGGKFRTAFEGDPLVIDRLLDYLKHEHYPLACVALISEDETAFGAATPSKDKLNTTDTPPKDKSNSTAHCEQEAGTDQHPISLYYPRDIATLRSAYERQSVLSAGKQTPSGTQTSTTLRGDLSEPDSSAHDTVRSYGGELTPLAQEVILLGITNILKAKQIQFVVLRSTNSLDQIFLAQFFRRAYPAARIVLEGSDLLFTRGAEGSSLRGVMTLSDYPLLTWQQDWTRSLVNPSNGAYRIFEEDLAEGLYIAARELFLDSSLGTGVAIQDYAPPEWMAQNSTTQSIYDPRPATWISVIGRHQFWPVAALTSKPDSSNAQELLPAASERLDIPWYGANSGAQPLRFPTEFIVVLLACIGWAVLNWQWCQHASFAPFAPSFRLAHFTPRPAKQHPALIAFGSTLPAAAAVVVVSTCGGFHWYRDSIHGNLLVLWRGGLLDLWLGVIILAGTLGILQNFELPGVSGKPSARWQSGVGLVTAILFAAFVALHLWIVTGLGPENETEGYWRNIHLLNGVSALLPQLILLVGMYFWFWFSLRGLALFGDDRPLLPKNSSLPYTADAANSSQKWPAMPMFGREDTADPVEHRATPACLPYLQTLGCLLGLSAFVFWLTLEDTTLRTIGERKFGIIMFGWLCLCIATILADTAQLWSTWRKLRPLLVYLDRTPLRRTLASLRGLTWGSVWEVSGNTLEERYRLTSRQFESMRHLLNLLDARKSENTEGEKEVSQKLDDCLNKQGKNLSNWYVKKDTQFNRITPLQQFQEAVANTAGAVMTKLLLPAWKTETGSLIFDRSADDNKSEGKGDGSSFDPLISKDVPEYVLAAEEFFVLPYLGFIQNILGRTRTIVLGSLCLFVAATFAVSSYPFDPLPVLGGVFLTVFVMAGGTLIMVYAQMHRDATLSHITNTRPGELGGQFWLHLVTFGVGPLLGLLTTLFPGITNFVASWLQPGVQALK